VALFVLAVSTDAIAQTWTLRDDFNAVGTAGEAVDLGLGVSIGYYCGPETSSYVSGSYYLPTSTSCFYLSPNITGFRFGIPYARVVGSSTSITSHYMAKGTNKNGIDDYSALSNGDDVFIAILKCG